MERKKIFFYFIIMTMVTVITNKKLTANERHFVFTYETSVLPEDSMEIEASHIERIGKKDFYHGIEQNLELEWGAFNSLQAAFYFNFLSEKSRNSDGTYTETSKLSGSSLELKYNILDQAAHFIGFSLYGEISSGFDEFDGEFKLLFDKKIGPIIMALNVTGEREWELKQGKKEYEDSLTGNLGISYAVNRKFSIGCELMNKIERNRNGEVENNVLYGGPGFSYAGNRWWMSGGLLSRMREIKAENDNGQGINERLIARFIFGFHI